MKPYFLLMALLFATSVTLAQDPTPTPTPDPTTVTDVTDKDRPTSTVHPGLLTVKPSTDYARPNAATRRKRFVSASVGPVGLGKMVATAGISTWTNSPQEWGTKWEGFARRVASNFGKNAIKQTTKFGLDEALKFDSHFYRSRSKGVGARVRNALISPVTARDRNGKRVVGIPNLAGTYTSSIIAYETWYPDRYDWKDGVRSGTISLGFNAAFNLFKEFVWKK